MHSELIEWVVEQGVSFGPRFPMIKFGISMNKWNAFIPFVACNLLFSL